MKNPLRTLPAMLLALFAAGAAQAGPTLLDLFQGASITVGDKIFGDWTQVNYAASDPARIFNAATIEVTALSDGGLDPGPGLRFTATNGELGVTGDGLFAYVDLMFGFSVTVLDPSMRIKDSTLQYGNGGAYWSVTLDGSYDAGSYIHENVDTTGIVLNPALTGDLASMDVEFSTIEVGAGQSSTSQLLDSATFAPQSKIWVTKNVYVWAADTTDSAGVFQFDQRFSQTSVPEPASYALVGIALAGMLLPSALRRRREARA